MIAPDGTAFPNHHRYSEVQAEERIAYLLLWGEDGPKRADAWGSFTVTEGWSLTHQRNSLRPRALVPRLWGCRHLASSRNSSVSLNASSGNEYDYVTGCCEATGGVVNNDQRAREYGSRLEARLTGAALKPYRVGSENR